MSIPVGFLKFWHTEGSEGMCDFGGNSRRTRVGADKSGTAVPSRLAWLTTRYYVGTSGISRPLTENRQ